MKNYICIKISFCRPSRFKKNENYFLAKNKRITHACFLYQKKKLTDNLTVLTKKGDVCLFIENLREVNVHFKTKRDVSVILINLRGR